MTKSKWIEVVRGVSVWIPTLLFAALFIMQGLMKLAGVPVWVERFADYGYPAGSHLAVGLLELLGGIGLLVPKLARYAALTLALVMLGAGGTHLLHGETFNAGFTFILVLAFGLLAYARSPERRKWRLAKSV